MHQAASRGLGESLSLVFTSWSLTNEKNLRPAGCRWYLDVRLRRSGKLHLRCESHLARFEYSHFGYSLQQSRFNNTTAKIVLDRAAKTGSVEAVIDTNSVDTGSKLFDG